jgi:hypothetical protein
MWRGVGRSHNVWTGRTQQQTFARTLTTQTYTDEPVRLRPAKRADRTQKAVTFSTINSLKPFIRVLRANQLALEG